MSSPTSSDPPTSWISENGGRAAQSNTVLSNKGVEFWLVFTSLCTCLFLSAFEISSLSTALPTIANALHASQFIWAGTAYSLSAAVFHPLSGGMAETYGRRSTLLITIGLFALGSGICGRANSMNVLIAGRAIQGSGGGGVATLTGIVLADLVTLQERGVYVGLYGLVSCFAAVIGPVVGGSLATQGQWRWLFDLNLPISLLAWLLVIFYVDLPTPPGGSQAKLMRMDWMGNFLVICSTVAFAIGLTWGGITSPWGSATVLVPLVLGLVGLVGFIAYEATLAKHPLVPFSLMTNMTSVSGYIQTFCISTISVGVIYFCPVYYQACKGASPVTSGVYTLAFASLAPTALVTGLSIAATKRYRPQVWVGWTVLLIALGLMSTVLATDPLEKSVGYVVLLGVGAGALNATCMYPIQAPLPVSQNAPAISFMWYLTSFAGVWGITIGGAVLQNELAKRLPTSFVQSVPQGTAIMYALIPELTAFPAEARTEVEVAFAESLAVLWRVLAGIGVFGFAASLFMRGLPLPDLLDGDWTLKRGRPVRSLRHGHSSTA